jgi:hypothetical protein
MKTNINGNDLLKHMIFWVEQSDEDCIEMATTTDGKLDPEEALSNMIEREIAIEYNKDVITDLKNHLN